MAAQKRGLGKGLEALLGNVSETANTPEAPTKASTDGDLTHLPLDVIQRGRYQPRREFEPQGLQELADSIKAQGVMQPIIVRAVDDQHYEIIAGERRWRASQLAQLDSIPVIVKQVTDEAAMAMALIENIQREDLNAMEEAVALSRLQDEFGLTQQEVADAVGKSRATVANLMRLNNLNPDVKTLVSHGDLEMGHARALLALSGVQQSQVARLVVARDLSVRQTEALVKRESEGGSAKRPKPIDPDIKQLQQELSDRLGSKVSIAHGAKGKGKLVISYGSADELEGILSHIK